MFFLTVSKSLALLLALAASTTYAEFSGDIVKHWNGILSKGCEGSSPRLGPHEAWATAYVHAAILAAADSTKSASRAAQQVAVSFAAHDALSHVFIAQQPTFSRALKETLGQIGAGSTDAARGKKAGEDAATRITKARAGDGADRFVAYQYKEAAVGVYQPTPPKNANPIAPNARYIRPFGGVRKTDLWRGPPNPTDPGYEANIHFLKSKGGMHNHNRTHEETQIGMFWLSSAVLRWNTIASTLIGDKNKDNVFESAKYFALVNFALANAGFTGWEAKYTYNHWRPITGIRWPSVYLANGESVTDPEWEPMLETPAHPDYLSGHSVFGGAAGEILKRYFKTDKLDPPLEISADTAMGHARRNLRRRAMTTRSYDSISKAVDENSMSRIYVGAHWPYACEEGNKAGASAAAKVWSAWDQGVWKIY